MSPAMLVPIAVAFTVGLLGYAYQALKPPPPKICGSPGVSKEVAKHKVIIIHGFDSSKDLHLPISQELIKEFKIYFLFFDRPGYGESDSDPSRSFKSEAYDVQELADKLSGAALVVPFVHYWWPCLPANLSTESFKRLPLQDQMTFRIAHYTPWLFYWWMTQKWFPSLSIMSGNMAIFCPQDMEILVKLSESPSDGQWFRSLSLNSKVFTNLCIET
ncbi:hypothetical protein LWI29_008758 [Acer saccharum]|uniref:AB hydrolase-1 domain-containing protein n=1 Tax=Acer saccharum TaxID=4024 RepID=A0AA39TCZ8_ACESA|nr:hypothetical protein LWI29_008758 [Acer saccharum]